MASWAARLAGAPATAPPAPATASSATVNAAPAVARVAAAPAHAPAAKPAAAAAVAAAPVSASAPAAAAAAAASVLSPSAPPSSSSPSIVAPAPVNPAAAESKKGAGRKKGPKGPNANATPVAAAAPGAVTPAADNKQPTSPPALLTTNSSHSTPSSAISTPLAVPSGAPSANPFHNGSAGPQQHQQHASAAPSSAASTPVSTSNSNPGSPARGKGRKKAGGGNQQQHNQHAQGNGPQNHPQHQQQQQSYPSNYQPYAFPLQIGPNGLPVPMTLPPLAGPALGGVGGAGGAPFLLPQSAGAGAPYMGGPQQFPGAPMMPQFYAPQQPQQHHGHDKRQQHHNGNNSVGTFYPHTNNPNYFAASSSAASAPYPYSPQQQQAQLAYQMANMSMSAASSAGPTMMYPSASSAAAPNSIQGVLPAFPVPFAIAPFADLLASMPLPSQSAPYFSVDVECIATGPGHNDRAIGHVAVVDAAGEVVLNAYVKPKGNVTSYLPALTGLSESLCAQGVTEEEVIAMFKACIPSTAVLVGQNVLKDVQWLRLEEGTDFASMLDLAGLFATKHPKYKSLTFFSLAHEAKALLCLDQQEQHHPAIDALLSIRLYQLYTLLQQNPAELERARALLLEHPVAGAFNKTNPVYDGVCMGNRKSCQCGSPWLG